MVVVHRFDCIYLTYLAYKLGCFFFFTNYVWQNLNRRVLMQARVNFTNQSIFITALWKWCKRCSSVSPGNGLPLAKTCYTRGKVWPLAVVYLKVNPAIQIVSYWVYQEFSLDLGTKLLFENYYFWVTFDLFRSECFWGIWVSSENLLKPKSIRQIKRSLSKSWL